MFSRTRHPDLSQFRINYSIVNVFEILLLDYFKISSKRDSNERTGIHLDQSQARVEKYSLN
jgi:hypothetical protein